MNFGELMALFIGAAFVNNLVLSQFLGICPFLGVSKKSSSALGMGAAIVLIIFISSTVLYGVYCLVLVPLKITYMDTLVFILVIASLVQFVEMFMKKYMKGLYKALGIFLPLITTNCAVLGVALQNVIKLGNNPSVDKMVEYLPITIVYSLASSIGFAIVLFLFSVMRERLERASTPKPFVGNALALVIAFIMAMAFSGLNGLV